MEVSGIIPVQRMNVIDLNQWHPGERVLVEVLSKGTEGEGVIRLQGQELLAQLETSAQTGETFWAKVGDVNEENVLLIRDPQMAASEPLNVTSQQVQLLSERGLPLHEDFVVLLNAFFSGKAEMTDLLAKAGQTSSLTQMINKNIVLPEWGAFVENNSAEQLLGLLRTLGLNYEQRLFQLLKLDPSEQETEKKKIKETLKYKLLQMLEDQEGRANSEENLLQPLLREITGQQLWMRTGIQENAYALLHLPLMLEGQPVLIKIALEGGRRGVRIDEQHCRVAFQVETPQLGEIGVDAFFNQETLTLHILTHMPQVLASRIEEVIPDTKEQFAKLGFRLINVDIGDLTQNIEFQNFLQGVHRSGVDVQR